MASRRGNQLSDDAILRYISGRMSESELRRFERLGDAERGYLVAAIRELSEGGGKSSLAEALWDIDFIENVVGIRQFIEDKHYLGMPIGEAPGMLFPAWVDFLEDVFANNAWELLLTGAIGIGKTTAASIAIAYKIYHIACLRRPQEFFGLLPGHPIVIGLYNVFKYKVDKTSYPYIRTAIENSPWFREHFPHNPNKKSTLEFPNNVGIIAGSTELHALGENLFGVLIDETDFMRAGVDDDTQSQAYKLYNATSRRMESRFMRVGGDMPGMLILVSSKTSRGSFMDARIDKAKGNSAIAVFDKSAWEVRSWRYGGDRFSVFVGSDTADPRILDPDETADDFEDGQVLAVPTELRASFEADLIGSLRDLAGVATVGSGVFIPSRKAILACVDDRKHPFSAEQFSIVMGNDLTIDHFLNHDELLRVKRSKYEPKLNPSAPRHIHIDLGITRDAAGFAMSHISGWQETTRPVDDPENPGATTTVRAPIITVDFVIRIVPTRGDRICIRKIREFVSTLRDYGYPIQSVTMDGFESEDPMQQLIHNGFNSSILSVDKAPLRDKGHPYTLLKMAIMEGRLKMYHHMHLLTELVSLERIDTKTGSDPKTRWKVDHPAYMFDLNGNRITGTKDVADAVCGSVFGAISAEEQAQPTGRPLSSPRTNAKPSRKPLPASLRDDDWIMDDYGNRGRVRGVF